jgi:phytoene dehydrogenase-like protein
VTIGSHDAVVVGAGPNGLAAAIALARAGRRVVVFERSDVVGGGVRSAALTLPQFVHDTCSSVYPFGAASPFFRSLSLPSLGVDWAHPPLAVAHPVDGAEAVAVSHSVADTAAGLGDDGRAYARLFQPLADRWPDLIDDVLKPVGMPSHPLLFGKFGLDAIRSARSIAGRFQGVRARALFAGLCAHSTLPLDASASAAVGLLLGALAHGAGWPFVRGGASRLAEGLAAQVRALGGEIVTGQDVVSLDALPAVPLVLCDVTPKQLLVLAGGRLPARYQAALGRYRYGPGVFKVDWALSGGIPWRASECRLAGTVHVGGTLDEVAQAEAEPWQGRIAEHPFIILTQPTVADRSRAPDGHHVAWGYCHVPNGSTIDMTERMEAQIERFAPGFRDTILARSVAGPAALERGNPNLVGGDIAGGSLELGQLFTRPTWRNYRTPVPGLYICSSSTPPGGGVHGMCGYHAARLALQSTPGHFGRG